MKRIIFIIGFSILILSCRKEGCMDINSASYDPDAKVNDGICSYRYLKTISINKLPDIYQLGMFDMDDPDLERRFPDFLFRMVKTYDNPEENYFDLITDVKFDIYSPIVWEVSITNEYLLTNSEYHYELVDVDHEGDEIIMSGVFIPSEVYHDNKIVLQDSNKWFEIILTYIIY